MCCSVLQCVDSIIPPRALSLSLPSTTGHAYLADLASVYGTFFSTTGHAYLADVASVHNTFVDKMRIEEGTRTRFQVCITQKHLQSPQSMGRRMIDMQTHK